MADTNFDVVVIGGGPGGYVAAIRAAQLGLKACVVEREYLGGICLNWGCIPTKALLRSAEVGHLIQHAGDFGWSAENISFDLGKIVQRSRKVAKQLSQGVSFLLKKNKVPVVSGSGKLAGKGKVEVTDKDGKTSTLSAKNIILATGARARVLPGLEPDGKLIWTYREAMVPESLPKSMIVVGSGAIGIEFASFYNDLGVEVTVVEVVDRILSAEDEEISALAHKAFEKAGIWIMTSAKVTGVKKAKDSLTATIELADGKTESLTADRLISAVGIVGNVEELGLEGTKVRVERGHIEADGFGATGEPGVWAIGDLTGAPWLAHKASHEGILAVETIAGVKGLHPLDPASIPGCTYARPQVASVGLSEAKAKAAGRKVRVGRFPFMGNGKAIALGDPEGLVKTVFDADTGELLGAHMIGAEVTELIQGFGIAKSLETTEEDLMHTVFPHPTLSEMMHESVLDAYDRALHF
ncbi:MAG: dihydrolipoyl dehydrogenase [Geminicoccus sp.]|nr:dihydrolipoyl dehydrogenase [Geminicoccus sp.]